ncbi:MAG TPA: patatin-like phospholipase family protein [Rickettsiales bacterium]|nr:patatin-like phospholipase family protein [Rickettsiales bacterium]
MAPTKSINLALQGGGAHGAYTWGVLDRLLEDKRLVIDGISGTSAGAMNAAVLADGYAENGREGAREALDTFWYNVSELGKLSPIQHAPFQKLFKLWNMDWSPSFMFFDVLTRIFSPYQTNPLNINPLRTVLERSVNFERLRDSDAIKLFIAATSVTTGQPRIFSQHELTPDAIMASACLPFLFQAVEIEDDCYWDGGYMGNPSIWPLTYHCNTSDIIIVEINPIVRKGVPKDGKDIINRLNEISFNASLIAEMRAIHFTNRLISQGHLTDPNYRMLNIHLIESHKTTQHMNASSKLNVSWDFFCYLHKLGREAADRWLDRNFDMIGKGSSVNIEEAFLAHVKHPKMRKK